MDQEPQFRSGDGSAIRVYRDAAPNNFLTEQMGRPVFDEVIFAEVISPGSAGSAPVFELERTFAAEMKIKAPMRGPKYEEYKQFVEAFKSEEQIDASLTGTPLKVWPEVTRAFAATLKAAGIGTVDALANVPDAQLSNIGPDGRVWREKARAYLALASGTANVTALTAENERLRIEAEASKAQIKELSDRIAALENEKIAPAPVPEEPIVPDASDDGEQSPPPPPAPIAAPADII